jgi:phospholipid/cholesterol/gamma-HCH transport system substrate-binding protein
MKIRFNKFEKVAGLFVALAILACVVSTVGIAVKNGWFSRKVNYTTELESADGIHAGTTVQIAGLRVGQVTDVDLEGNDRVLVKFEVLEKFQTKVRADSRVHMFRPFILAEKVLEVTVGNEGEEQVKPGGMVATITSTDIMDLLSGKKMGTALASFDKLADSLKILGNALADPKRTKSLVEVVDRLNPLVENLNTMSVEVSKIMKSTNREVPDLGPQLGQIVKNMNVLTAELQKLTPAINSVAPELPRTSRRAIEALDETVVLLKAMQKSFLLKGNVDEVRKEENRRPANTSDPQ